MEQWACVDLPAFPLQLVLRRHPDWAAQPAVVVDKNKPQGVVLWANEAARAKRVLPGARFASALSLVPELRADVVDGPELLAATDELVERLLQFSPQIEPDTEEPGVFWLDAAGLERLAGSMTTWATAIHRDLTAAGYQARVVVGFTRFGTYAVARALHGKPIWVFTRPETETRAAHRVPIERLAIAPAFRDALQRLGVHTIGQLVTLPPAGVRRRFGLEAHRLIQMARGESWKPIAPRRLEKPITRMELLDEEERDSTRLLFLVKGLLDGALAELAGRRQAVRQLELRLELKRGGCQIENLRPAEPTLDARALLSLVRLRLETLAWSDDSGGVHEVELTCDGVPATREQLLLFVAGGTRRDPAKAAEAFAQLRARYGNDAVVQARLVDGHLPEASFTWEAIGTRTAPVPTGPTADTVLVRRVLTRPQPLSPDAVERGSIVPRFDAGAVTRSDGPFVISGGWWAREVHREYHFIETQKGALFWVYFDRVRRRWFMHGAIA